MSAPRLQHGRQQLINYVLLYTIHRPTCLCPSGCVRPSVSVRTCRWQHRFVLFFFSTTNNIDGYDSRITVV